MWNFCTELFSSFYKSTSDFSKKKSTIHKISRAHKTPSFHLFFLAVIAARSRPPLMNARMCVFPAARCLKNWEWCNKGTNRRQREAEAIRGCRKDIWLDWIPTAATLQRAALQTVLFYNTIQYNTTKAGSQPFLPLLLARKIIENTIYPDTPHSCTAQLLTLWCFF